MTVTASMVMKEIPMQVAQTLMNVTWTQVTMTDVKTTPIVSTQMDHMIVIAMVATQETHLLVAQTLMNVHQAHFIPIANPIRPVTTLWDHTNVTVFLDMKVILMLAARILMSVPLEPVITQIAKTTAIVTTPMVGTHVIVLMATVATHSLDALTLMNVLLGLIYASLIHIAQIRLDPILAPAMEDILAIHTTVVRDTKSTEAMKLYVF